MSQEESIEESKKESLQQERECPFCNEMFTSEISSCPLNIADHQMCPTCIKESKKFFKNQQGCYYCGDRKPDIKIITIESENENRLISSTRSEIGNNQNLQDSIFDENGKIICKKLCDKILETLFTVFITIMILAIYSLFTYAYSAYKYLWINYVLGYNVEYETEKDPITITLTAILGFIITAIICLQLFSCYLCCCCCDKKRFTRFDSMMNINNTNNRVNPIETV